MRLLENVEKTIMESDFSEKQRKIIDALYSRRLWQKLSNYILLETEKTNRQDYLTGYPYWLVIDPANFCTLKCPFCPTGQDRKSRAKVEMSFINFKKIVDKLGPYLIHIDFCNWGEPLLNKEIFQMIKYAKQYDIDTKIDSNLNQLTDEEAGEIVLSGLDKVIVSIDGVTPETYSKYRVGGDFKKAMENLKLILKKKKELRSKNPYIVWQFLVFRHNEHEIDSALRMGQDLGVDHVGITKAFIGEKDWFPRNELYSNYKPQVDALSEEGNTSAYFKISQAKMCNWPWEVIVVNSNGSVSPCCSVEDEKDDFGNIFKQPFKEIWNNQKYRLARNYIKDKGIIQSQDNNICVGCRHLGLINIDILSCHSFFDKTYPTS